MFSKKLFSVALAASVFVSVPAFAKTLTLQDLQDLPSSAPVVRSKELIKKHHWAYKRLVNISSKYGLDVRNGKKPLTRDEAAVILVNLVGKIEQEKLNLSESERAQVQILKEEFGQELTIMAERIATLQASVDSLKGSVSKMGKSGGKSFTHYYGKNFKIGGLLQARYDGNLQNADHNGVTGKNFSFPVAEFRFKGQVHDKVDYLVSMIPSRSYTGSSALIGETRVGLKFIPNNQILVGQTRLPMGHEGAKSPTTLDFAQRAQIGRRFNNTRDIGVKVVGGYKYLDYYLGVYNGAGQNQTDNNNDMALGGWAMLKPLADTEGYGDLRVGGGYFTGKTGNTRATAEYEQDTWGFYGDYKLGPATIKGEYSRRNGFGGSGVKASGWYITGLYDLTEKLQLAIRYDRFDPNTKTGSNAINEYAIGTNYFINGKALKLQVDGVYSENKAGRDALKLVVLTQYMF